MLRKALGIAALLGGVSYLALKAGYAAAFSGPDESQVAHVIMATIVVMGCYGVFKGVQRCFRGSASSFWTSTLGRWLIGRMAGMAVFGSLAGTGFGLADHVLLPMLHMQDRFGNALSNDSAVVLALWSGAALVAWQLRAIVKVCIGKGSRPLRRLIRSMGMGSGGSSAFAGICEEWACRWRPGMILLGASMFDRKWLVGVKDDRMMMTVAGTGAGKGRSAIIPNLLTYPGSVYCQDFKGQNAAITAQRRRDMGQVVHILDPMGALMEEGARLNPLEALDPEARDYVEQVDSIVDALVIAGDGKNVFWDEAARTLIAGLIDYVVRRGSEGEFEPPADDTEMEDTDVEE